MRHLIALAVCTAGMLTCGAQQSEAQFYGYYAGYYPSSSCCYRPVTSYYAPVTSYYAPRYYVSAYAGSYCPTTSCYAPRCCPTTACYQPCCPQTCCPQTNCCPTDCGTAGACGAGGCATYQPAPVTAALPPRINHPVKTYTRARVLAPVRTTEYVSTEKPVESKPLVHRATLRSVSQQQEAPSTGWEAIN